VVLGGLLAHLGVGTRAEPAGELTAHVKLDVGVAHQQRLGVGVDGDELDALEADLDHPVDGVDAAAADADDLDDGQVVVRVCSHERGPSSARNIGRFRLGVSRSLNVYLMVRSPFGSRLVPDGMPSLPLDQTTRRRVLDLVGRLTLPSHRHRDLRGE
jgi:hypothetical protein